MIRLRAYDPAIGELPEVKEYLAQLERVMNDEDVQQEIRKRFDDLITEFGSLPPFPNS